MSIFASQRLFLGGEKQYWEVRTAHTYLHSEYEVVIQCQNVVRILQPELLIMFVETIIWL